MSYANRITVQVTADVAAARVRMRVEAIKAAEIRWWQDRLAIVEGLLLRDELLTAGASPCRWRRRRRRRCARRRCGWG